MSETKITISQWTNQWVGKTRDYLQLSIKNFSSPLSIG